MSKKVLRTLALLLLVATLAVWVATGANRGWTKTSVPVTRTDEVTGITVMITRNDSFRALTFSELRCWDQASWQALRFCSAPSNLKADKHKMTNQTIHMKTKVHFLLALACLSSAALAAPQSFDFKDPKGVNNATFKLDAPLEALNGNATGISGTVTFDPADPAATKGKIVVATASLHVGNSMQQQHMLSDKWLDAAKYPEIVFEAKELKNLKTDGDATTADVSGAFTLKGISKEMTVPVKLTYLKDKLGQRVPKLKGDLLVIRANFTIKRSDFGIMPGQMEEKVSDAIELTLSIAGASPR
jgi:polyisoprenoid-binding protein YceI